MREIKFRAWDKAYKKMVYDYLIPSSKAFGQYRMAVSFTGQVFTFTDAEMVDYDEDQMKNSAAYVERFELMQFTGLHDKNGREIYEGDVLLIGGIHVWVEYRQGLAAYLITDGSFDDYLYTVKRYKEIEVIGNVHYNPLEPEGGGDDD